MKARVSRLARHRNPLTPIAPDVAGALEPPRLKGLNPGSSLWVVKVLGPFVLPQAETPTTTDKARTPAATPRNTDPRSNAIVPRSNVSPGAFARPGAPPQPEGVYSMVALRQNRNRVAGPPQAPLESTPATSGAIQLRLTA